MRVDVAAMENPVPHLAGAVPALNTVEAANQIITTAAKEKCLLTIDAAPVKVDVAV